MLYSIAQYTVLWPRRNSYPRGIAAGAGVSPCEPSPTEYSRRARRWISERKQKNEDDARPD
jgi:hypothetical protein